MFIHEIFSFHKSTDLTLYYCSKKNLAFNNSYCQQSCKDHSFYKINHSQPQKQSSYLEADTSTSLCYIFQFSEWWSQMANGHKKDYLVKQLTSLIQGNLFNCLHPLVQYRNEKRSMSQNFIKEEFWLAPWQSLILVLNRGRGGGAVKKPTLYLEADFMFCSPFSRY